MSRKPSFLPPSPPVDLDSVAEWDAILKQVELDEATGGEPRFSGDLFPRDHESEPTIETAAATATAATDNPSKGRVVSEPKRSESPKKISMCPYLTLEDAMRDVDLGVVAFWLAVVLSIVGAARYLLGL